MFKYVIGVLMVGAADAFRDSVPFEGLEMFDVAISDEMLRGFDLMGGDVLNWDPYGSVVTSSIPAATLAKITNDISKAGEQKVDNILAVSNAIKQKLADLVSRAVDTQANIKPSGSSDEIKDYGKTMESNLQQLAAVKDARLSQLDSVVKSKIEIATSKTLAALDTLINPPSYQIIKDAVAKTTGWPGPGKMVYTHEDIKTVPGLPKALADAGIYNTQYDTSDVTEGRLAFNIINDLTFKNRASMLTPKMGTGVDVLYQSPPVIRRDYTAIMGPAPIIAPIIIPPNKVPDIITVTGEGVPKFKSHDGPNEVGAYFLAATGVDGVQHFEDEKNALAQQKLLSDNGYDVRVYKNDPYTGMSDLVSQTFGQTGGSAPSKAAGDSDAAREYASKRGLSGVVRSVPGEGASVDRQRFVD